MAPQSRLLSSTVSLRTITQLLATTPAPRLPHIAPLLATYLGEGDGMVCVSELNSTARERSEYAILVHQFKTQVSALFQNKTPEELLGAVILVKTAIENGSLKFLQEAGPWIRSLLGVLARPGNTSIKPLCTITLTRTFLLTQRHPDLIREITTPALPGFISSCLGISNSSKKQNQESKQHKETLYLDIILQSFIDLIQLHPASFRPFSSQLQSLLSRLLAPTNTVLPPTSPHISPSNSTCRHARRLFALLHVCALKNHAADAWAKAMEDVLQALHRTADLVFRGLVEDWTPKFGTRTAITANDGSLGDEVADAETEPLSLPAWAGIHAGLERLNGLLQTLRAFIATKTSVPVNVPVHKVMHIIHRILSAYMPKDEKNARRRPEFSREESENLYLGLSTLHLSAIKIISSLITRFGTNLATVMSPIAVMVSSLFESQSPRRDVRQASYEVVAQVLLLMGQNMPRHHMEGLSRLFRSCCDEIVLFSDQSVSGASGGPLSQIRAANYFPLSSHTASYLKSTKIDASDNGLQTAATTLLSVTLTKLPDNFCDTHLRAYIDRTAILAKDKQMMLSSTMNPPTRQGGETSTSSILPLLARQFSQSSEVEALIHPQMPILEPFIENVGTSNEVVDAGKEATELGRMELPRDESKGTKDSKDAGQPGHSQLEQGSALVEHDHVRFQGAPHPPTPTKSGLHTLIPTEAILMPNRDKGDTSELEPGIAVPGDDGHNRSKRRRLDDSLPLSEDPKEDTGVSQAGKVVENSERLMEEGVLKDAPAPVESGDKPNIALQAHLEEFGEKMEDGSDESDFEMPQLDVGGGIGFEEEDEDSSDEG